MNFYRRVEELIFGTRLKRLSEKFLMDVARIYKSLDIPFEVSWFPIFYLLNERKSLSITEIANELGITHSAISQMVNSLERNGLIKFVGDRNDRRRRLICFTPKGSRLMSLLPPIWRAIKFSMREMFMEGVNSSNILQALDEIEDSIERESLYSRVITEIDKDRLGKIDIIPYQKGYHESFKNLILSWIIDSKSEPIDSDLINNTEKKIAGDNMIVLLARVGKDCIGTIVTAEAEKEVAEIKCFVVDRDWQNRKVGARLLEELILRLKEQDYIKVRIRVERRFTNAIRLLRNSGFLLKSLRDGSNSESMEVLLEYEIK